MCRAAACECEAILSACCPQTSWPSLIWTLIYGLSFCARTGAKIGLFVVCPDNGGILLANSKSLSFSTLIFGKAQGRLA
jgi:hypothetical protein